MPPMLGFWPVFCPCWSQLSTLTICGVHSAHFSENFVYTNLESASFWQIYLNGLKLHSAAVTSRLSIAALLSLLTPSCPLKSAPQLQCHAHDSLCVAKEFGTFPLSRIVQRSRRRSGCRYKYLSPWIHTVKWCEVRRECEFVPVGSLPVSSRRSPAVSGASRSAKKKFSS